MSETDPSSLGKISSLKKKVVQPNSRVQLSLPRLKKVKRDLLTDLPLDSQECQQEILSLMRKSFHSQASLRTHEFRQVQAVNNPELTSKYLEKRREWKSCGYSDSLLADTYAFLPVENQAQVEKLCRKGVCCGNQSFSGLGVSHMAVHLNKHADILDPSKPSHGDRICIIVKLLKGKVKTVVCKNVGVQLEPTPNYDCHISKPNVEQTASLPYHLLFYSLQLYVYEYGDLGVEDYPKQILPFAVIHYTLKEVPVAIPKQISNVQRGVVFKQEQQMVSAPPSESSAMVGPRNEVWRGKLHVSLVDGGNLNIEVSLFSHFVPLTVNLLSPLKIYKLYPESNAQFTYFAGLTDIADKAEVPWREHYFRSFVMRPRRSNEDHFKALVKHISDRREMPCVGLPNDVYLFLMTNCLLSSQLGLVQRDDNSPVLYCVVMSKFSTIKAEKKKMKQRMGNGCLRNYGKAPSWPELFEDSDKEEEESDAPHKPLRTALNGQQLESLFQQQRLIQNKLAALSLADMAANIAPCDCVLNGESALHQRDRRNSDIVHMVSGIEASIKSHQQRLKSKEPVISHFPPGSRTKPRHGVSRRSRAMPSFSPHGSSSDSDSDYEQGQNGKRSRGKRHYSVLMNSHKTVEEELSEEELTAEQMDDIIFMRKPSTVAQAKSSLLSKSESKQTTVSYKSEKSSLLSKPKIIPVEPMIDTVQAIASQATNNSPQTAVTKIIPTDPLTNSSIYQQSQPTTPSSNSNLTQSYEPKPNPPKPKSILKKKFSVSTPVSSILKISESSQSSVSSSFTTPPSAMINTSVCQTDITMKTVSTNVVSTVHQPSTTKAVTEGRAHSTTKATTFNTFTANTTTPSVIKTGEIQCSHQSYPPVFLNQPPTRSSSHTLPLQHPSHIPMEDDMGDIDMRVPPPHLHSQQAFSSFLSPITHHSAVPTSSSSSSHNVQHCPMSPSLKFGSWLGPQDLPKHSNTFQASNSLTYTSSPFSRTSLSPSRSPPSSTKSLSSPFKPCAPVEEQFDIDISIASPPSMSPPSPSPLDSPMSPPKSPTVMELESPASPPISNELRSSPIAIPTVRVYKSLLPSFPSPNSPSGIEPIGYRSVSPSPCNSGFDNEKESPSSTKQVENADDMKDFLNSATGFDSELDSPNEDDSFMNDGCLQKEVENADDMKYFLNAGIGGFESESPYEDDR